MLATPKHLQARSRSNSMATRFVYEFPVLPSTASYKPAAFERTSYRHSRPRVPSYASTSTSSLSSSSFSYHPQHTAVSIRFDDADLESDDDESLSSYHQTSGYLAPPSPILSGERRRRSLELEKEGAESRLSAQLMRGTKNTIEHRLEKEEKASSGVRRPDVVTKQHRQWEKWDGYSEEDDEHEDIRVSVVVHPFSDEEDEEVSESESTYVHFIPSLFCERVFTCYLLVIKQFESTMPSDAGRASSSPVDLACFEQRGVFWSVSRRSIKPYIPLFHLLSSLLANYWSMHIFYALQWPP